MLPKVQLEGTQEDFMFDSKKIPAGFSPSSISLGTSLPELSPSQLLCLRDQDMGKEECGAAGHGISDHT